jgi:hypothetical protein
MNMPGFTAEASLYRTSGRYQMAGNYEGPETSEQILPQLPRTFCDHDPYNICWYICCTVDTTGPYGIPTISCTKDWVCGHKNPGAGVFYGD